MMGAFSVPNLSFFASWHGAWLRQHAVHEKEFRSGFECGEEVLEGERCVGVGIVVEDETEEVNVCAVDGLGSEEIMCLKRDTVFQGR